MSNHRIVTTLPHLNGNLPAVIDVETTGSNPKFHEICQIAIVPLDERWCPHVDFDAFYTNIRPKYPERMDPEATSVHGLTEDVLKMAPSQETVYELACDWFENINLPLNRRLIPIAHNYSFEARFLSEFFGSDLYGEMFNALARDTMIVGTYINDKCAQRGWPLPFEQVRLGTMCKAFNISLRDAHNAYADCVAEAELYRNLMAWDGVL